MSTVVIMKNNAENCRALAEAATEEPAQRRYQRMAAAWADLAEAQEWLDGKAHRPTEGEPQDRNF